MAVRVFSSRDVGERSGGGEVGEISRSDGISGAGGPGRVVGREALEGCGEAAEADSAASVADVGAVVAEGAADGATEGGAEAAGFWVERGQKQKTTRTVTTARQTKRRGFFMESSP